MPKRAYVSRSFMKRLVRRLFRGHASMFPSYMMYFNQYDSSEGLKGGIEGESMQMDSAMLDKRIEQEMPSVGAAASSFTMKPSLTGVLLRKTGSDVTPGLKTSVVAKNLYMQYSADAESLQSSVSIPCFIQELEYCYPADWATDNRGLQPAISWDVELEAVSSDKDMTLEAKRWISQRWRSENGATQDYRYETGFNPYFSVWTGDGGVVNNTTRTSAVSPYTLERWCSDLKNPTDGTKGLRFIGSQIGSYGMPTQSGSVVPNLLKIDFTKTEPFGNYSNQYAGYVAPLVNHGCEIVFMRGDRHWFLPVVAQRSGKIPSTSVFGPLLKPLSHEAGMNPYGFITATSNISVTSTQSDYKTKTVLNFTRGGAVGKAEYFLERYLCEVIERSLTCHLPDEFEGKEIPYFTNNGKWSGNSYFGSQSYDNAVNNQYEQKSCLGPVSYPSAQQPDSEWLWFVSEDEEDSFWLNKLRLGYAGRAIPVTKLERAPIQIEVDRTKIIILYVDSIMVWNTTTSVMNTWTCGDSLPAYSLKAVAVDRSTNKWWFGHADGVFLFDNGTVADLPLASWPSKACGLQGLNACNGYLAWSASERLESTYEYAYRNTTYACWWNSNTGTGRAIPFDDMFPGNPDGRYAANTYYSHQEAKVIGRVAVRSNGELIVTHTQQDKWNSAANDILSMSVFKISADLIPSVVSTLTYWTHERTGTQNYTSMWLLPLKVVNDVKVVGGLIFGPNTMTSKPNQPYTALGQSYVSRSQLVEVTIDDENRRIHIHPDIETAFLNEPDKQINTNPPNGMAMFDRVNYPGARAAPADFLSSLMMTDKVIYAMLSFCVIQLKSTFAVIFAGRQDLACGGMPLSWTGSAWSVPAAGKGISTRKTDATAHVVDTNTTVSFNGPTFAGHTAYAFVCMPSTSDSPDIALYFGDFVKKTETVRIVAVNTPLSCLQLDTFYAVDLDRTETLACVVNGQSLEYVASSPNALQFSVSDNGHLVMSVDHIGSSATVSYNYVAQG